MKAIRTAKTTGTYGAPFGLEDSIGGLPFHRETLELDGGSLAPAVISYWTFSDTERARIAAGANIELDILGEPIPPVALSVVDQPEVSA